jgi:AraC-like DNA-binding protein
MVKSGFYGRRLGEIFHLKDAPAFITRTLRKCDIAVTEIKCDAENNGLTKPIPPDDALLVTLQLRACPHHQLWIDGRPVQTGPLEPGVTCFYDLRRNPIANSISPFHSLQFYLPLEALNLIADRQHTRRVSDCNNNPGHAVDDQTIRGLGYSLVPAFARPNEASRIFVDNVTLAMAAYVLEKYTVGDVSSPFRPRVLAASYERRAKELLAANLNGEISISELARDSGLPIKAFLQAFRQSTGTSPHRWLRNYRIECAKDMLRRTSRPPEEIAPICGYASTDHFIREFKRAEGTTPSAWRSSAHGSA